MHQPSGLTISHKPSFVMTHAITRFPRWFGTGGMPPQSHLVHQLARPGPALCSKGTPSPSDQIFLVGRSDARLVVLFYTLHSCGEACSSRAIVHAPRLAQNFGIPPSAAARQVPQVGRSGRERGGRTSLGGVAAVSGGVARWRRLPWTPSPAWRDGRGGLGGAAAVENRSSGLGQGDCVPCVCVCRGRIVV